MIPLNKMGEPPTPALSVFLADKGEDFQKLSYGSETLHMTSQGSGGCLELTFQTQGVRNQIGAIGNSVNSLIITQINELSII